MTLTIQYLSPLRGRIAFGLATAAFSIYIYNNYNSLPSFKQLKTRFFNTYFKGDSIKTITTQDTDTDTVLPVNLAVPIEPITQETEQTQASQVYNSDSSTSTPCETPRKSSSHTNFNSV